MAVVYSIASFRATRRREHLALQAERVRLLRARAAQRIENARRRRLQAHVGLIILRGQYGPRPLESAATA